jgi:hypothetical protein
MVTAKLSAEKDRKKGTQSWPSEKKFDREYVPKYLSISF